MRTWSTAPLRRQSTPQSWYRKTGCRIPKHRTTEYRTDGRDHQTVALAVGGRAGQLEHHRNRQRHQHRHGSPEVPVVNEITARARSAAAAAPALAGQQLLSARAAPNSAITPPSIHAAISTPPARADRARRDKDARPCPTCTAAAAHQHGGQQRGEQAREHRQRDMLLCKRIAAANCQAGPPPRHPADSTTPAPTGSAPIGTSAPAV